MSELLRRDAGSGSLLTLAIGGAALALTAGALPLLGILSVGQAVHNAADAAALAAADTASGALAGIPCESASQAATMNDAQLSSCAIDGPIASVTVRRSAGGFILTASARAGPPGR
ncbi:MAG TPA: Rv3654c family TadE-like protein [Glaciibacter sp.]|nr:Rv3654c family TadE-like protein [Glaciibacter sp.]